MKDPSNTHALQKVLHSKVCNLSVSVSAAPSPGNDLLTNMRVHKALHAGRPAWRVFLIPQSICGFWYTPIDH